MISAHSRILEILTGARDKLIDTVNFSNIPYDEFVSLGYRTRFDDILCLYNSLNRHYSNIDFYEPIENSLETMHDFIEHVEHMCEDINSRYTRYK